MPGASPSRRLLSLPIGGVEGWVWASPVSCGEVSARLWQRSRGAGLLGAVAREGLWAASRALSSHGPGLNGPQLSVGAGDVRAFSSSWFCYGPS